MNNKRNLEEKLDMYEVFTDRIKYIHKGLDNEWIRGFVDGEGCFYFYIGRQQKRTIQLQASLEIGQNDYDYKILEEIKRYLNCGRLKPKELCREDIIRKFKEKGGRSSMTRLIISNATDIKNKIIPFFDNNILLTTKNEDYNDWKKLVQMKEEKQHLNLEGLKLMKAIKSRMNKTYKKRILPSIN